MNAKEAVRQNWLVSMLVALVLTVLGGGLAGIIGGSGAVNFGMRYTDSYYYDPWMVQMAMIVWTILLFAALIGLLIRIFVTNLFMVGGTKYFIHAAESTGEFGDLLFAFRENYGNVVKTMFLRGLYEFLWSLLFVIPGMIKSYQYRMVPYILADHPHMDPRDALALSKEMMRGNKWKTFLLDLSFIPWLFLSALTAGIVGILWVNPYCHATYAELYLTLRMPPDFGRDDSGAYDAYGTGADPFGLS